MFHKQVIDASYFFSFQVVIPSGYLFMNNFLEILSFDPILPLLASSEEAVLHFTRWDLLGEVTGLRYFEE
jgi:hypothetical protein